MINSYISQQIERNFPYKPTDDQFLALHTLTEFLLSEEPDSLLLMKGYAGTGKTSLVGALVKTLNELKQKRFVGSNRTSSQSFLGLRWPKSVYNS